MEQTKKIVILNKSQGEIDWLVFNQHNLFSDGDLVYVYCNIIDKDIAISYAPYFFSQKNIFVFNLADIVSSKKSLALFKFDDFFGRISSFMINKINSRLMQNLTELSLVFVRRFIAMFVNCTIKDEFKFHDILFENNFRSSILFEVIKRSCDSKYTNITLFPHHFGPLEKIDGLCSLIIRSMNISRCLVNNKAEEQGIYKYLAPETEEASKISNPNETDNHFLFLTRQCSTHYGFKYDEAFQSFELSLMGVRNLYPHAIIKIKNHPRDIRKATWNEIAHKYGGTELVTSAIDFCAKNKKIVCIHFYTSLVEPLNAMGIKCLDISPYKTYENINFAFYEVDGKISNSYIDQKKTQNILAKDIIEYI
jgi:hypothetical protein